MQVWDPFYAPDPKALQQHYHFVSCTEAIEHFINPAKEWHLWLNLLLPEGVLASDDQTLHGQKQLSSTGTIKMTLPISAFFHQGTFEFLAQRDRLELEFPCG